ncbi:retrovirus-related Pol polyprotein from transposon 297 [Trichonephila clavipes]|nr:retrovirus-related Pol polyprotein from transposon 297 [Trichonephila clavipes]
MTPVELPYVPILLNETFITALWDTGAEKSFISEEVYRNYFSYRPRQKTKDRVVTAQGAPCNHLGRVELQIRIREFQKPWEFHILDNMQYQCILGIDFMKASRLTLDFDQKSLIIPDHLIKQTPKEPKLVDIDLTESKLDDEQQRQLKALFNNFKGLFSDQPGLTHVVYHEIDTGDKGPVVSRPYKYDRVKQGIIDYHIDKMLRDGTICPINSPYASPVVLTRKNNDLPPDYPEAYRFAIDYRKLNAITKYPRYPLPVIDDLLTNIPHTNVMSTLDLRSGYFQLAISPKDIEKTAFITRNGTFAFLRMPFGLSGAAPNFQRAIDIILQPVIGRFVSVYMDDVIITSPSFKDHLDHLTRIFTLLRDAGLTLNKEKCHFARDKLKYLGLIISKEGIETDNKKIRAITEMKPPKNNREFKLFTDASGVGIGAVLQQNQKPIAFASRTLNKTERNYTVTERECLAVIWALNKFKTYFGPLPVKVITDHAALTKLTNGKNLSSRMIRWALKLSEFNIEWEHRPGVQNVVADLLSRNPVDSVEGSQISCAALRALAINSREQFIKEQREDPELRHIYRYLENPDDGSVNATICESWSQDFKLINGLLFYAKYFSNLGELRVYIPGSLRKDIMKEFHDLPLAGHLGKRKTYLKLRDTCYFPFMRKYIFEYVSTCDRCQKFNYKNALPAGRLMPIVSKYPNEIVTLDLVGPYPASRPERYKFILVITDHFTKWSRYGAPISLISDNGPQFISDVFEHLSHRLDIKHMKTVTYRPQSNLTERVNRNLVQMIASFVEENHENWDQFLHEFAFALRTAVRVYRPRQSDTISSDSPIETLYDEQEVSHGSNRSNQGQFKEHRKTSSQESERCRSRQSNTTREIPRNKRKINSTASKDPTIKTSKICRKRSRQGSDHQDRKRHAPEQRQGVKRSIPSSISSRNFKFKRPNTSSPGIKSIASPSKLPDRRNATTTSGSRMEVSGRDNQTRQTRATTRRHNEQAEKTVPSNQTNTRRPCPYYLRSRIQEKDRIHENLNNIEINGIPGSIFRRRSLSMEAMNGDPVHRI